MKKFSKYILGILLSAACAACADDVPVSPGPADEVIEETDGGYVFAFMTNANYGKLYYAASRDGYNWTVLNNCRQIDASYRGHPDICQGPDGTFYMISTQPLQLWTSSDLTKWDKRKFPTAMYDTARKKGWQVTSYWGAPKIMYDDASGQFMITWHGDRGDGIHDDWDSMRTLYVLTKDFVTFTDAEPLFDFTGDDADMSQIDCIVRKIDGRYYAIVKDERSSEQAPLTFKSIRIASSDNLTGPYSNPGPSVTPTDAYREAPILVEQPHGNGYFLYAEYYASKPFCYGMFKAPSINGPWVERPFNGPNVEDGTDRPGARHGCIVKVNEPIYQAVLAAF